MADLPRGVLERGITSWHQQKLLEDLYILNWRPTWLDVPSAITACRISQVSWKAPYNVGHFVHNRDLKQLVGKLHRWYRRA